MAHMQQQIYCGGYYSVETNVGIEIVPDDMVPMVSGSVPLMALRPYVEGTPLADQPPVVRQQGWLARLSAPGYLDCTEWTVHASEVEAKTFLDETYGDDDGDDDDDEA